MARPRKQPTPEEQIKKLEQGIVNLKAELDNERGLRRDGEAELYERLKRKCLEVMALHGRLVDLNRRLVQQQDQNIALRHALKEVL